MKVDFRFASLDSLEKYLIANPGKAVGFTYDTPKTVRDYGDATEWYGIKLDNEFDGECLVIGYYGSGIRYAYDRFDLEEKGIQGCFIETYKKEWGCNVDNANLVCVCTSDFPIVEVRKDPDFEGEYQVVIEGEVYYNGIPKESADTIADAINKGIACAMKAIYQTGGK